MNIKNNVKDSNKREVTTTHLIRWSGLCAILSGMLYVVIQFIHPSDHITSVQTNSWVIVACLTIIMSLFCLIGLTGIYTRQVKESGWLGLIGYVIFSLFWLASIAFSFIEAFVLPLLTADAPSFVEGFLGIFGGFVNGANLGILPNLAPIAGGMYIVGGLLLGIATFRARVLPQLAGALLAFSAVATLCASIIPHPFDRILAVPMGAALIWLGYSLLSERKHISGAKASTNQHLNVT